MGKPPIEGSKAKLSVSGVNGTLADLHEVDGNNYVLALCPRHDNARFGAGKPSFNTFQLEFKGLPGYEAYWSLGLDRKDDINPMESVKLNGVDPIPDEVIDLMYGDGNPPR